MNKLTCEHCGEHFIAVRRDARFCTNKCRLKAKRQSRLVEQLAPPEKFRPGDSYLGDFDNYLAALGHTVTPQMVLRGQAKAANAPHRLQRETVEAVCRYPRVAVRSAHNLGKTYLIALLGTWWLLRKRDNLVLVASAKESQVSNLVLSLAAQYCGQLFGPRSSASVGTRFIYPDRRRSPRWAMHSLSGLRPEAFASYHAVGDGALLVIIDECSALLSPLAYAVEGIASGHNCHVLYLGNPLGSALGGPFHSAFREDSGWHCLHWATQRHPNIEHDRPIYPAGISYDWLERCASLWGWDSDEFQARCLGEWPKRMQSKEGSDWFITPESIGKMHGMSREEVIQWLAPLLT